MEHSTKLSAKYTPGEIEDKWYQAWIEADIYRSVPDEREPYTIVIPPPNVTGVLHMGHMLNNTIQDVLIRRKRTEGYNALWVAGTDHASIATEAKVVKMLADQGIQKKDITRDEFMQHALAWKDKYGGIILSQLRKLGASCDWSRTRFTMDADYYRDVIQVFCDLYDKGLIYRGIRLVNWDPQAQTAVSDEEVIYQDTQRELYYVRYPYEDGTGHIIVATTRPETIMGDVAVAVHPEDPRYTHLHGKQVIVPMINRPVPVILDEALDREFGTGALKVTPAHDPLDYEIGLRHGLPAIDVLNPDGTIAEVAGLFVGMDRFAARKAAVRYLQELDLIEKTETYTSPVGVSERTSAVIEPRLSQQWFLKMKDFSRPALDAVLQGDIELIPGKFVNTYRHWMENVRDWCLSRQLWWGHRIPVWYIGGSETTWVVAPTEAEALTKARTLTGNPALTTADLRQDDDVLDTWASSWLWPISLFDGIQNPDNEEFKYYYPTHDLVTAPEILFLWVARMAIAGYEYTGKRPFRHVYLTGIVRDKQRRKMSKSLGNSPDPLDLIAQYGADAVRVGMLLCAPAGNDILYDDSMVEQGRNFANKIWNAFRLVSGWQPDPALASTDLDQLAIRWMENRLGEVEAEVADHFSKFRLSDALMAVYKLIWDDFCAWLLEMVKPPYGAPVSAATLEAVTSLFERLMLLLHPFMPFISEELWQHLRERAQGTFIATQRLAETVTPDAGLLAEMGLMQEMITAIRAFRAQHGLSPKDAWTLSMRTDAPALFTRYQTLLTRFLNLTDLVYTDEKTADSGSVMVRNHTCFIPLPGLDREAERVKVLKEIEYTEGFLASVMKKLGNEKFVANAKPEVVDAETRKKQDAEARLEALRSSLKELS